jgi:hypothetical protein
MDPPTILDFIQYDLIILQMVRRRCTSSNSNKFDIACIYPTLALDIQYDFSTN